MIHHVAAYVIIRSGSSSSYKFKLLLRKNHGTDTYDSFGGYKDKDNLVYKINALRLELFDEGNIIITDDNLISASNLFIRKMGNGNYTLLQIFVLKDSDKGKLFSWENASHGTGYHVNQNTEPIFGLNFNNTKYNGKINRIKGNCIKFEELKMVDNKKKVMFKNSSIQSKIINHVKSSFDILNKGKYIYNIIKGTNIRPNIIYLSNKNDDMMKYIKAINKERDIKKILKRTLKPWDPISKNNAKAKIKTFS